MLVATLSEMLEEVVRLGEAAGMEEHAHELRGELEGRLATIRAVVAGSPTPRVIALESLDPPRVAGFWIPEMISIAGGEDVAGDPGLNPAEVVWGELEGLGAEVVVVMPDGSAADAHAQAMEHWEQIEALGAARVYAVDAAAAFAEPGPRLVDGVELLAHLLHPELMPPPGNPRYMGLSAPVPRS
jgi:iron complex transport system substrate-binding protein